MFCRLCQVFYCSAGTSIVEILQHALTNHEIKFSARRPGADVTQLVTIFFASMLTYIYRNDFGTWKVFAIPVIPIAYTLADV